VADERVALAGDLGMDGIRASETDPVEAGEAATGGVGADVVFEAVGGDHGRMTAGGGPLARAYDVARPGGTVVQVGTITNPDLRVDARAVREKPVQWIQPREGRISTDPNMDFGRYAADLIADGRVSIDQFITHEIEGLDGVDRAIDVTLDKEVHGALGPAQLVVLE
jgi:threonine dehydrogenase-like Zn-dependent dehydrogenase